MLYCDFRRMSLENLHCPQFVDFMVPESFDINDGADFFFEKGVVGEEMDLGTFRSDPDPFKSDGTEEIVEKMQNMTNLGKTDQTPDQPLKEKSNKPVTRKSLKDAQAAIEDKENQQQKPCKTPQSQKKAVKVVKDVAPNKLDSAISSAIEMISNNTTPKAAAASNKVDTSTPPQPEALKESFNRNKTLDKSQASSTPELNNENSKNTTPQPSANETSSTTTPEPPQSLTGQQMKPKMPVINNNSTNPSIVKKTLAKMTAAFNKNKPIVMQNQTDALKSKRAMMAKSKQSTNSSTEYRSGRNSQNSSVLSNFRSQKRDDSITNESRLSRPMSPEASSSRRCSSVPRTLRERQALNSKNGNKTGKSTNKFGEKIQNFFNKSDKSKLPSRTTGLKTLSAKNNLKNDQADRRRSRSVNQSINTPKTTISSAAKVSNAHIRKGSQTRNDSMNKSTANKSSYTKITASPSFSKPRQNSAERTVNTPTLPEGVSSLHTGVKFVPNSSNSFHMKKQVNDNSLPAFSFQKSSVSAPVDQKPKINSVLTSALNSSVSAPVDQKPIVDQKPKINSVLTSALGVLPVENILKSRPACMQSKLQKPGMNNNVTKKVPMTARNNTTLPSKSASFRNNTSSLKSAHPKSNMSDQALNVSTDKLSASNASRIRKTSESNSSINGAPSFLHTELRAAKRQEYEQHIKERDRKVEILKKEMELDKLRKQQEEIQKIRNQRTFRSNPIKYYKPVDLKPSVKHLTEPVAPNLSTSQLRLNNISRNDSCNVSSSHRLSMALVDAPLNKKSCPNSSRAANASTLKSSKQRTVSQNDLNFE